MATMQKLRAYQGPALFSYGFRPFFLFGAIYAGAMVPLWLAVFAGDCLAADRLRAAGLACP